MSEYKRFISYVYEYPQNKKGANRGFLKVECRNEICQMVFSLRGICRDENSSVEIFGFRRAEGRLQGSPLAQAEVHSGTLNLQLQFPEGKIGTDAYTMEELAGVILVCADGLLCVTQWDDEPLNFEGFPNREHRSAPEPHPLPEELPAEKEIPAEAALPAEAEVPAEEAPSTETELPAEAEPSAETELPAEAELSAKTESQSEAELPADPSPAEEAEEVAPDTAHRESAPAIQATSAAVLEQEPAAQTRDPYFRDGSIIGCTRITPQDINRLQPEDWYLSGNRFVHHGYQAFGHLLVGRLADSGDTVFCVPGVFHPQERSLAGMYGFHRFIQCPGHPNTPRSFGYWCRSIHPAKLNQGNPSL